VALKTRIETTFPQEAGGNWIGEGPHRSKGPGLRAGPTRKDYSVRSKGMNFFSKIENVPNSGEAGGGEIEPAKTDGKGGVKSAGTGGWQRETPPHRCHRRALPLKARWSRAGKGNEHGVFRRPRKGSDGQKNCHRLARQYGGTVTKLHLKSNLCGRTRRQEVGGRGTGFNRWRGPEHKKRGKREAEAGLWNGYGNSS